MFQPLHPLGFVAPCLPTFARSPPEGAQWAYEIKHDGLAADRDLSIICIATSAAAVVAPFSRPARQPLTCSPLDRPPGCEFRARWPPGWLPSFGRMLFGLPVHQHVDCFRRSRAG